jgi:hypothetical protein
MGYFGRKDSIMILLGATPAAVWIFWSILLLQSTTTTATSLRPVGNSRHALSRSNLNIEAKNNLARWLNYVHASSDSGYETWAAEEEHVGSFSDTSLKGEIEKENGHDKDSNHFAPKRKIVVAKDGSGHFTSIQAAVNHIPQVNKERVLIKIKAGVYRYYSSFHSSSPRSSNPQVWNSLAKPQ